VTNGVHVPSFLTQEWQEVFDRYLGFEWTHRLRNEPFWEAIHSIPDHVFWSVRQSLKAQMLLLVRHRITTQHYRNNGSEAHLDRLLRFADPVNTNVLTLGFARRFATYKRATLLFEDLGWLRQIVLDADRPVLVLFAGKAHPADVPGQDLIRRIAEIARMPEFEGRLLLVEDYDLRLARRLVSGVDVWLNNPIYPLEASGTSGMKAGINGALNLSVLDGWWEEGYDGKNGWAIKPASAMLDEHRRDREEARTLYEILQDQVIPLYYERNQLGYSPGWVRMAKHSMATLMPRFNAARMVGEYVAKFYLPASKQWRRFLESEFEPAQKIADWKRKVRAHWSGVQIRRLDTGARAIRFGETVRCEVGVRLNGLAPEDVRVEMLLGRQRKRDKLKDYKRHALEFIGLTNDQGEHVFALEITPDKCGKLEYQVRAYPCHPLLTHPFETGLMVWL
jgi:starch phosphorylase